MATKYVASDKLPSAIVSVDGYLLKMYVIVSITYISIIQQTVSKVLELNVFIADI